MIMQENFSSDYVSYKQGEICPSCKGTGFKKTYSYIQNGKCFKCLGHGTLTKVIEDEEKKRQANIKFWKEHIAIAYKKQQEYQAKGIFDGWLYERNRINAKNAMKNLKEWNGTITLEEIKEIAKGLE